ncbi:MAG: OsmC family protein [Candidatus Cloacimonadia bacterium]
MEVELKHIEGLQFKAVSDSNHAIILDSKISAKYGQGARPMELILMGLVGCAGMDIVSLLQKMRIQFNDFVVTAKADIAEEHPKVFTSIHIIYKVYGNVDKSKLERAIELTESRYCPVYVMLKKSVPISYEYKIIS